MTVPHLTFNDQGLVPAIVQDIVSKEVLMLAYMNKDSLEKSIETGETWFYSRSRQQLWHKGATSGNTQKIIEMKYDCDKDALLVLVEPAGVACHNGTYTCFTEEIVSAKEQLGHERFAIINQLEQIIAKRETEREEGSYTTYLFDKGVDKILKKVGEETAEVIIAAKNRNSDELTWETADLLYHLLVLLREQKLPLDDVLNVLEKRHKQ
ncbi:bifunctional phosphoribosyl-AMP cyclohydrolase/phosphoribosyl-ATP diphosphatase HisIE [Cytobacillus sp. IB215665]|uniref:bifunctional phosphoribosyl-AMP cyclohydrolase/phosphoribosyl-ATP diphosphatase HisIE n=1 Tax=Cytobacillus sp. IB215665 TaxID=3097357 RepID=UPI002A160D77|nr:bifunctional phosphoribosyl-AMP cyclohydrolase/phosphoribosyl-ATP diphosphatase HisIE [Cytobacillus sp. IB215665]MDX8363887.1 bifunctional phosphoribosyl-AMP cyclohydrolase/phosphoribosyl-ATP diphosphatase HisIE [Cytobacillus sp. IB215665]